MEAARRVQTGHDAQAVQTRRPAAGLARAAGHLPRPRPRRARCHGRGHTADQIGRFLAGFYGDHGPSAHDREHRVSQVLKDRQQENADADVLLCAQNKPHAIGIGPVTVAQSAAVGWATVTTHWAAGDTDTFTAYVRLDSRPIRVDDVICAG
ncbi:hypothetical protein WKI68_40510 [Streptomyces sp. MS1.HAVA.3]|uniref:Uncharacterized protein n=1 Tax=Streptomyces caledonius TaxID=3134107 RepID=A0ABU8UD59_9ACTN